MDEGKAKEAAAEKRKKGWIDVWMAFETVAIKKEVTESAINAHIEKMGKVKDTLVYDTKVKEAVKVEKIPENFKKKIPAGGEMWSQVAEARAVFKDLFTLINVVMVYGPSAVEIHEPSKYSMKADEMQNITNLVAGLLHEFASAGAGGVVISGERG